MKKAIIGGFTALISSLWAIALSVYCLLDPVESWYNSRFWSTAAQRGVVLPMLLAFAFLLLGVILLGSSLFSKEK